MGVKLTELLPIRSIRLDDLSGKIIAVDAYNHLYQYLSSIRSPTGELFTDEQGNVTSHLMGLFYRTAQLMQKNIKMIYVFDGKPPELKRVTNEKRRAIKQEAATLYEAAAKKEDIEGMRKYASRLSTLNEAMVDDAKQLLRLLGIPIVQAPSEADAQAALLVRNRDAYAVGSQDADSFMFGSTRLIRNISISGRRKKAGSLQQIHTEVELIEATELLDTLKIDPKQFIGLCMLIGTDYAPAGIKGIGPAKALKAVHHYGSDMGRMFDTLKWSEQNDASWEDVYHTITDMPVAEDYAIEFTSPDIKGLTSFLIDDRGFSPDRVTRSIELLKNQTVHKGLDAFIRP